MTMPHYCRQFAILLTHATSALNFPVYFSQVVMPFHHQLAAAVLILNNRSQARTLSRPHSKISLH